MQATAALCKLFDIHLFKDLDLNLRDLNTRESCVCVCRLYSVCSNTHLSRHSSNCLTSTTMTFESNPSSPLARPCLTKDNPHRSAPAPCLLSSAITAVPQNPSPFSKKKEKKKSCHHLCKVFAVLCEREHLCVMCLFTSRQEKEQKNVTLASLIGIAFFFFFISPGARANKSNQCSL